MPAYHLQTYWCVGAGWMGAGGTFALLAYCAGMQGGMYAQCLMLNDAACMLQGGAVLKQPHGASTVGAIWGGRGRGPPWSTLVLRAPYPEAREHHGVPWAHQTRRHNDNPFSAPIISFGHRTQLFDWYQGYKQLAPVIRTHCSENDKLLQVG